MFLRRKRSVYLDHAATTPLSERVLREMNSVYKNLYANPGSVHAEAVGAKKLLEDCRARVAKLLGTTAQHVVFTRGGTESNNMAIMGCLPLLGGVAEGRGGTPHIVTSAIEHAAVLETLKNLECAGSIELSVIGVNEQGIIDMDELKKALRPDTALVSIMYVNNEVGTIQPIREISKLLRWYKRHTRPSATLSKREGTSSFPLFHVDAIQAANHLDIHVDRLGVDLMSLSGSKIYGPKSSGVLYVRDRSRVSSMFHGGDQEFGLRAGTEDLPQVVGFTTALEDARKDVDKESVRLSDLQKHFFAELKKNIPDIVVNGSEKNDERVCNNVNVTIPGISGERLVIELDAKGIAASSKSACKEDNGEASHVIAALRGSSSAADGSVRFSMGRSTTISDINYAVRTLKNIVTDIRTFEKGIL